MLLEAAIDIRHGMEVGGAFVVAEELELPLVVVVGSLFVRGGILLEGA